MDEVFLTLAVTARDAKAGMGLRKGGESQRMGTGVLACLLASFQGHPTSEKSQGRRRHLASAHLCQAARQAASSLRGARRARRSAPPSRIRELWAQRLRPALQLWAAPGGLGEGAKLGQ